MRPPSPPAARGKPARRHSLLSSACHPIGGSGASPGRCPSRSSTATPRLSPPNWHRVSDTQCQNNPSPPADIPQNVVNRRTPSSPNDISRYVVVPQAVPQPTPRRCGRHPRRRPRRISPPARSELARPNWHRVSDTQCQNQPAETVTIPAPPAAHFTCRPRQSRLARRQRNIDSAGITASK